MHLISNTFVDYVQLGPLIFSAVAAILVAIVLGIKNKGAKVGKWLLLAALISCIVAALTTIVSFRVYTI